IELILLAVNINLVAFSTHLGDIVGQIYALLVLTVAAAEAAIGLAILVVFYRNRGSIAVEDINLMKGWGGGYQAIVFLSLLGAIIAGLIALAGARARFPGKGPVAGPEDTPVDHGPPHGEPSVEGGGIIQSSRHEQETHEPAAAGSRSAELITTTLL